MPELRAVNDFVIKFANVNGTGSASANNLFAKAVFRMGVPVSPRNIFPSNIQGLPTWYEVRVSEAGHLGRRGGVDIMVAMTPATLREDVDSLLPGGYLLHDSTKPLDRRRFRSDINWLGVPLTEICLGQYSDPRQRQLFKNIVYVGALSALLDMEFETVTGLVADQFRGKDRLIAPNVQALELGSAWARENLDCPIGLRVRRSDAAGDRILVNGNSAAALGCVYAGATVAAWYPITPSTSLVDAFTSHCERLRVNPETGVKNFAVVQAEDELAAIGMAIGACWNGARGFTATSGPGISLMTEFLGLAYFAEIPVVLFNIQRGSPSTGMPTRTQQADIISCAYASHGDTKHVLLFPKDPTEAFELAATAFDLAERLQTPVIVMSDLDLGMNDWTTDPFRWDDARRYDRGKILDADGLEQVRDWGRYLDVDGDGIPWRTIPATHPERGAYLVRGTSHDEYARYTEDSEVYLRSMERIARKFGTAARLVPQALSTPAASDSLLGVIYFGTTSAAMEEALEVLREDGIELDALRIRAFPFGREVFEFIARHATVYVVEQNRDAQMRTLLVNEGDLDPASLVSVLHYDGLPITSAFIAESIRERLAPDMRGRGGRTRQPQEAD
ncbi:MAG: 2-oxoacid:acceptor oxidoreductase subunit alpha [Immundisolibacterales bacterium]|nr:2-oxoacid:acceptor oxidoreductase subunit alpha [Immundisolibacterales bacterium]